MTKARTLGSCNEVRWGAFSKKVEAWKQNFWKVWNNLRLHHLETISNFWTKPRKICPSLIEFFSLHFSLHFLLFCIFLQKLNLPQCGVLSSWSFFKMNLPQCGVLSFSHISFKDTFAPVWGFLSFLIIFQNEFAPVWGLQFSGAAKRKLLFW